MSFSVAIGFSQAQNPQEAAHQASVAIKNKLNSITTDMVIVFTSISYAKKEILDVIYPILKPIRLIGSSCSGIILSEGVFNRGLAILAINSSSITFGIGSVNLNPKDNPRKTGFELGHKINLDSKTHFQRQAAVVLCDGISQYNNQFMAGVQEILGRSFPLAGTLSCDDFKLQRSYQFYQKQILSNSSIGFLINSMFPVAFSNKHGFKPLGKPRTITSVEGPIIHTIDHRPAVKLYEEYLKDVSKNLKNGFLNSPVTIYPLGVYSENQQQYLLRYPVDILTNGSIVCQTDIPPNTEVHLMISNRDSCKNAATAAAQEIKYALGGQAQLLFIFESMGRQRILSHHLFLEIQAIKELLGDSVPIIGMYGFGELCPLGSSTESTDTYLQNGSLSLLAI